jgi:hypothetical protein
MQLNRTTKIPTSSRWCRCDTITNQESVRYTNITIQPSSDNTKALWRPAEIVAGPSQQGTTTKETHQPTTVLLQGETQQQIQQQQQQQQNTTTTKYPMGIQSQHCEGSVKAAKRNGTRAKARHWIQTTVNGGLAFEAVRDCKPCRMEAQGKISKKGHHPRCIRNRVNRRNKGKSVRTAEVERIAGENI